MLIYKDIITQDEMLSDSFKIEKLYDGHIYKVVGNMKKEKAGIDDKMIGGNASAEGADADERAVDAVVQDIDVKIICRLAETGFGNKKEFKLYLGPILKTIKKQMKDDGKSDDDVANFQAQIEAFMKDKLMPEFKELQFFLGESNNPEGLCCFLLWEDNHPTFYYISAGLVEEKF